MGGLGMTTVNQLGLGGADRQLRFEDLDQLVRCVTHLIGDRHGHHFAVVDDGHSLILSGMAVECLRDARLLSVMEIHRG
jgi:hypothetical protein